MATSRTQQTHDKRVQQIAEEAAAKIAADSPLEEDIVVTIEELPPRAGREPADKAAAVVEPLFDSPFAPMHYLDTLAAVGAASAACVQGIFGAQLRFAGRFVEAVSPRTR